MPFFDDVAAAVAEAKRRAGDGVVAVCAGDVGGQALALGLVDEVAMDVVPVVFGGASDTSVGSTASTCSRTLTSSFRGPRAAPSIQGAGTQGARSRCTMWWSSGAGRRG